MLPCSVSISIYDQEFMIHYIMTLAMIKTTNASTPKENNLVIIDLFLSNVQLIKQIP